MVRFAIEWLLRDIFVGTPAALMIIFGIYFELNKILIILVAFVLLNVFAFFEEQQRRGRGIFRKKGEQCD